MLNTNGLRPIQIPIGVGNIQIQLELDTGSPVTIVNSSVWEQLGSPTLTPPSLGLSSYSGHSVPLKGETMVDVSYNNRTVPLLLRVADGSHCNILGRDWLEALDLTSKTLDEISLVQPIFSITSDHQRLQDLLAKYDDVFQDTLGCCKIKAHLHIKPNTRPVFCRARSLPFAYKTKVEDELDRLVTAGVIEPIDVSEWAAPIVVVPKPEGKIRICADFSTGVNRALDVDKFPLPKPNEMFSALNGGTIFSKIDLSDAYFQIELDEESKKILVINTHKGLFRFNRLPFGVASATGIFQRIMEQMITGLQNTGSYLDDSYVTGQGTRDHLERLDDFLNRVREFGFHVNKKKCEFLKESIEFLGFIVDKCGIRSSPAKTKAIVEMPPPEDVPQLRSFLGMVNHYSKFIPDLASKLSPLYRLLKKDAPWCWSEECKRTFSKIKDVLISPLALTHYDPEMPLLLAADASNAGVGVVIYHRLPDGSERAIAHASKTLSAPEQKYSQIEKEALAIVYGCHKFDQYLRGRIFILLTDHKPLVSIFGSKKGIPQTTASRLQRWAIRLLAYNFKIEYRPSEQFGQADGLSRLPVGPDVNFDTNDVGESLVVATLQREYQQELPLRASQIAQAIRNDVTLSQVHNYVLSGWPEHSPQGMEAYFRIRNELTADHGCILWGLRTVIPPQFRQTLLEHLHSTHAGMARMKAEARRYFWWPGLDGDVENVARQCQSCTMNSNAPQKVPLQQWPVTERPWQRIHIDFMGKFLDRYFLVVVDSHSKWLEVFPMKNISAEETVKALMTLFARFGLCDEIVSDNGAQFTSEEFASFCARHGIRQLFSPPGHPQSNGQAERYVETVKAALMEESSSGESVDTKLQRFLFRYRSTPHTTTNATPAELFLKRNFRTVLDLLRPTAAGASEQSRIRAKKQFDSKARTRNFNEGDRVLARDFRGAAQGKRWSPGVLIRRKGAKIWVVQVGRNHWKRHENQIKLRQWTTDEDVISGNTPQEPEMDVPATSAETSVPLELPVLRRSSRIRKPVSRFGTENA